MATTKRESWYQRLFGRFITGQSTPKEQSTILDRIKAAQAGRAAAAIAEQARSSVRSPSMSETVSGMLDDTPFDLTHPQLDIEEPDRVSSALTDRQTELLTWDKWQSDFSSSKVAAYRYELANHWMNVRFVDGSEYAYECPPSVFRGLVAAASKGSYMAREVEPVYPYHEITGRARKYRKYPPNYVGDQNLTGGKVPEVSAKEHKRRMKRINDA